MFTTRPSIIPLGLDLVELEGGGSCPSQFYGRTQDARPVYIRYRNGRLTVHRGAVGETDYSNDWETLLDETIGPYLHGDLLLEQACDLAGISVRGEVPPLSRQDWRNTCDHKNVLDWTGDTTYWNKQIRSTESAIDDFTDQLRRRFSIVHILEMSWDKEVKNRSYRPQRTATDCEFGFITYAFGGTPESYNAVLAMAHVREEVLSSNFEHLASINMHDLGRQKRRTDINVMSISPLPREYWSLPLDEQYSMLIGRQVVFASSFQGAVSTKFRTDDSEGRIFFDRFLEAFETCFANTVEVVELQTGVVRDRHEAFEWYSRDLVDWCAASPDRYLNGFQETEEPKQLMAWRPASVTPVT